MLGLSTRTVEFCRQHSDQGGPLDYVAEHGRIPATAFWVTRVARALTETREEDIKDIVHNLYDRAAELQTQASIRRSLDHLRNRGATIEDVRRVHRLAWEDFRNA